MPTPLSDLLKTISDGGGNTGVNLCFGRLVCGASPSIGTDHGFASVARNGVGDYTITLDNAYSGAPCGDAIAENSSGNYNTVIHSQPTSNTIRVLCYDEDNSAADPTALHVFVVVV
jgi:hypothetical protein